MQGCQAWLRWASVRGTDVCQQVCRAERDLTRRYPPLPKKGAPEAWAMRGGLLTSVPRYLATASWLVSPCRRWSCNPALPREEALASLHGQARKAFGVMD